MSFPLRRADREGGDPHGHDQHLQGKEPGQMRVLEIGCGAGGLRARFRTVRGGACRGCERRDGRQARARGRPRQRVRLSEQREGSFVLGERVFDFAFSTIVFQHIPSYEVIESYVGEVVPAAAAGRVVQVPGAGERR